MTQEDDARSFLLPSAKLLAHRDEIVAMAARHGAQRVRVFGSIARGEDTPSSDIDLLVQFGEGASLYDLVELEESLSRLLESRIDIVSEAGLKGRGLHILEEAKAL